MKHYRSFLISAFTFVAGLYFFLEWALPSELSKTTIGRYHEQIIQSLQIVSIMSIGLGVINLLFVYGRSVLRRQKGWGNSVVLLVSFVVTLVAGFGEIVETERALQTKQTLDAVGVFSDRLSKEPDPIDSTKLRALHSSLTSTFAASDWVETFQFASTPNVEELRQLEELRAKVLMDLPRLLEPTSARESLANIARTMKASSPLLQEIGASTQQRSGPSQTTALMQRGFWVPLGSAMFALLAFYIASAAYRSLRVRSLESACIMLAALLVILGQIPHGPLYVSEHLPAIRLWILEYINASAFRAIYIGSMIAGLAMAIRIWLSLEKQGGQSS